MCQNMSQYVAYMSKYVAKLYTCLKKSQYSVCILQHSVIFYHILWHSAAFCDLLWHFATFCDILTFYDILRQIGCLRQITNSWTNFDILRHNDFCDKLRHFGDKLLHFVTFCDISRQKNISDILRSSHFAVHMSQKVPATAKCRSTVRGGGSIYLSVCRFLDGWL